MLSVQRRKLALKGKNCQHTKKYNSPELGVLPGKIPRTIRCARRRRGNTEADVKLLDALENAALSSYTRDVALINLRNRLNKLSMESHGLLFQFMLLWFIGGLDFSTVDDELVGRKTREELVRFRLKPFKEQVDEVARGSSLLPAAEKILHSDFFIKPQGLAKLVPYKELVDQHRQLIEKRFPSIVRDLSILEKDRTLVFPKSPLQFNQVELPDAEVGDLMELAATLQEQKEFFRLCTPKLMMTHFENFRLLLLHARLWLLRSELPVCFGDHLTYNDLRSSRMPMEPSFQALISERAREQLPSIIETDQMLKTVNAHSRLKDTEEVYHMKQDDYLESSRWNTPGYPVVITPGNKEKSMDFRITRPGLLEEDDEVEQTVRVFEDQETLRVLAELRKFNPISFARFSEDYR